MDLAIHSVQSIRIIERRSASTNRQYFSLKIETDTDWHDIVLFVEDGAEIAPITLLGAVKQ
tara:strand:+ start:1020 stop:1202 length:183 start_codon:yes stop_codon:yes gene_type:complete